MGTRSWVINRFFLSGRSPASSVYFYEYYGTLPSCSSMPPAEVLFRCAARLGDALLPAVELGRNFGISPGRLGTHWIQHNIQLNSGAGLHDVPPPLLWRSGLSLTSGTERLAPALAWATMPADYPCAGYASLSICGTIVSGASPLEQPLDPTSAKVKPRQVVWQPRQIRWRQVGVMLLCRSAVSSLEAVDPAVACLSSSRPCGTLQVLRL